MKALTDIQTKFLDGLRSGTFQQAKGTLKRDSDGRQSYCCLGVACEVVRQVTGRGQWEGAGSNFIKPGFVDSIGHKEFTVMPRQVYTALGLVSPNPVLVEFTNISDKMTATALNDGSTVWSDNHASTTELGPVGFSELAFLFEHLFRTGRPMRMLLEHYPGSVVTKL
jgi:hypothetical protein